MKYEIDFPAEIEEQLNTRASQMGKDVVHLIQIAVVRFVGEGLASADNAADSAASWSEDMEIRRRALIDKDIVGTISDAEREELARRDLLANADFDQIAPPPINGARQLHQELLSKRDNE